jgi:hypothetical protein
VGKRVRRYSAPSVGRKSESFLPFSPPAVLASPLAVLTLPPTVLTLFPALFPTLPFLYPSPPSPPTLPYRHCP